MRFFAGPFVGEFGWELFCWQGHLRYLAEQYDEVIVAGRYGHDILYKDFCDLFVPIFGMKGSCQGPYNRYYIPNDLHRQYDADKIIAPETQFCKYRIDCRVDFLKLKQKFVKYGVPNGKYDLLIHARYVLPNDYNDTSYRNWPIDEWRKFVEYFQDLKIASIGTEAYHIEGTDDLRNIQLSDLVDYMAGAKMCIGPSSGPMHLASLCRCPQVVWWGDVPGERQHSLLNRYRYLGDWNPFGSQVVIVSDAKWDTSVSKVIESIETVLGSC